MTAQKKDLALGLDLVSEVVLTPTFPEAEVARKVSEIQAAIKRSEEDPGTVAARALGRLVFDGHPYGRPVEGTRESVARLTRDDVVKFHREHFRPDATVVAVVGAVTVDEARREILARFGSWPRPAAPLAAVPSASAGRERHEEAVAAVVSAVGELGRGRAYAGRYRAGVARVTARDVQRAAQRFFAPESFSRVVVGRIP